MNKYKLSRINWEFLAHWETVKAYDATAKSFSEKHSSTDFWNSQLEQFERALHGTRILDAGCGPGRDALHFTERGYDVTGIDLSSKMLAEAERRAPKAKFMKMNMAEVNFPDKSFDGIWCCASLLHIRKSGVEEVIRDFWRIMKDDGVLFVSVRGDLGSGEVVKELEDGNRILYADYSKEELSNVARSAGFITKISTQVTERGEEWLCALCQKPKSVYYMHPISLYGTDEEKQNVEQIKQRFPKARIENPSEYPNEEMAHYLAKAKGADAGVFSPFEDKKDCRIDGEIGAGVVKEVNAMLEEGKPVFGLLRGNFEAVTKPVEGLTITGTVMVLKRKGIEFDLDGKVLPRGPTKPLFQ